MPRVIKFKQIHLISYTGHDEITVDYGDITKLSGRNGEGKSSIGEAPAWIMWGVDLAGGKYNPSPTDRPFERVFGSLLMSVDGVDVLLAREIVGGDNKFYINEVPKKAKEYEAFIANLFDKEQFLSLYNPSFFFTQHWTKQREQVMKHVTPPSNKEVFQAMSRTSLDQKAKDIVFNPQAARLEEELKKHPVADLEKKYADLKNKNDKLHIQSQGSVKTLTAQLEAFVPANAFDRTALEVERDELDKKIQSFEADRAKVHDRENERRQLQNQIDNLSQRIESGKQDYNKSKVQEINTTCHACGQELTEEAKKTLVSNKKLSVNMIAENVNKAIEQRKGLKSQLESLPPLDGPDYSIADLMTRVNEINSILHADSARVKAAADLEKAKQNGADYLKAKNDAIFVLDAIKQFKSTEAELQVSKVQSLFTRLSVRLFDYIQSTGEYKPTFVIQMDGKDYPALSLGEKMNAGLEIQDVLFKQSELVVPCFLDNIESYTGEIKVYGQVITGRAVPDQRLKIEPEEN